MGSAVSKEPEKWPRKLPPPSPPLLPPPLPLTQMYYQGWKYQQVSPLLQGEGGGGEEGGEGIPTHQSPWLPRFFHFVTRRFYLSCLEGYLNNSPSGLKETEADNKHAPLLSPEHHPLIKTSSRDVREKGRGTHAQCLSSHLPPLTVPPQSVMETELFVNHRCYPANHFRQFSSYGAKPRSTKSERMVYCPCMV